MTEQKDFAPWESDTSGRGSRWNPFMAGSSSAGSRATKKVPPLPEIFQSETGGFVAATGETVPRLPTAPRRFDPRGRMAIRVLWMLAIVGVLIAAASILFINDPETGSMKYVYAGIGVVISVVCVAIWGAELGRMNLYKSATFYPAIVCYGTKPQFMAVAGPAGIAKIASDRYATGGKGVLDKLMDRSAKLAASPEVVTLLLDRGRGPEFVSVDWDSVRKLNRGDIAWYTDVSPTKIVMLHSLIPYAPTVMLSKQDKHGIYVHLYNKQALFMETSANQAMGEAKVFDESGQVLGNAEPSGVEHSAYPTHIPPEADPAALGFQVRRPATEAVSMRKDETGEHPTPPPPTEEGVSRDTEKYQLRRPGGDLVGGDSGATDPGA